MIVGDNIIIPSANRIFATTKSKMMNGTNMMKLISNEVFNSLIMYAGATCQIVISSGDFGFAFCESYKKNTKSFSRVCFSINSFKGFEPS